VYASFGGGSGLGRDPHLFQALNEGLGGGPWSVIVATGDRLTPSELPPAPENLFYYRWLPGPAVIRQSDAVIFHGGYGTMMETVRYGVPSVVLPFQSEQESNGRRLEDCGSARLLNPALSQGAMKLVRKRWQYGEFATWIQMENLYTSAMVREAVSSLLEEPNYRQAACALSAKAAEYGGACLAANLVDDMA
jgi:UDP:flavonoid glycosyltransferase YjiC (YdhE family)